MSQIKIIAAILGVLALAVSIVGAFHRSADFFQSYLFSFLFWSDLPLGALPLLMIYHLTGGSWGAATRRILEAISDTILAIAILSLPILIGLHQIYPWMDPAVASDPKIGHKHLYLNASGFRARAVVYFLGWFMLNGFMQHESESEGKGAQLFSRARLRQVSAGGLLLTGLLATFASIDWQMSIEPKWSSTIYGMVYAVGQSLTSYAFCLAIFAVCAGIESLRFTQKTLWDMGNILLTLVMVWTYLSFMQYLIIWSGNLPHEVTWFAHRTRGGWQWLALVLALFQFAAPFILLLFRSAKSEPIRLAYLGVLIFVVRIVDHYWQLIPGLKPERIQISWEVVTTWFGIGGIWFALFLRRLQSKPLFAEADGAWETAVESELREVVP